MLGDGNLAKVGDQVRHKHNPTIKGKVVKPGVCWGTARQGNLLVQLDCGLIFQASKYVWRVTKARV